MHFANIIDRGGEETDALLRAVFQQTRMAMIATDPRREDNPIVLVNPAFEELTGYEEGDAVGRNCRFLQGPETDRSKIDEISQALDDRRWGYFEVRNYRKDGTPFWNALHVGPVFNEAGELIFFFGSQWDVSKRVEAEQRLHLVTDELAHRIRNMFALVLGIVDNTDTDDGTETYRDEVSGRLRALVDAHESIYARAMGLADATTIRADAEDVAKRVLAPYDVRIDGPAVPIDDRAALDLALALHELATNSVKYGALSVPEGRARFAWKVTEGAGNTIHLEWTERDGPPAKRPDHPGFGSQLLGMIAQGIQREDAGLRYEPQGLTYRFSLHASSAGGDASAAAPST